MYTQSNICSTMRRRKKRNALPCLLLSLSAIISLTLGFSAQWTSPRIKTTHSTLGAAIEAVNGDVNGTFVSSYEKVSSRTLTPYEILHGRAFFPPDNNGSDRAIPLHACLRLLRKTLNHIIDGEFMPSGIHSLDSSTPIVFRIEHKVSHPVDPLCWLHAQSRSRDFYQPTLYFANSEQTLETAVFGSTYTHSGSSNADLWELIKNLPESTQIYGGERFDTKTQPSSEWSDFGSGLWILPAVELRQTRENAQDSFNSNGEHSCTRLDGNTTIAIHLCFGSQKTLEKAAQDVLHTLSILSDSVSDAVAPTTLPPIISRESSYGPELDGQEIYEMGVAAALEEFDKETGLEKVVLARRMDLKFDLSAELRGLDMVRKWKFGGHEGGHLFYLNPGISIPDNEVQREFVGCTPERLFQIRKGHVISEALAGTRPRGSTQEADEQLSRDLFQSPKDREENLITGHLIRDSFQELYNRGWLRSKIPLTGNVGELFVRRLRHLQHICQRFHGTLRDDCNPVDVSQYLLESMHPTPAVGGYPGNDALMLIRKVESFAFDRGYYAGPFGYFGRDSADVVVAIRSGLLKRASSSYQYQSPTSLSIFAGAGIVPGSTVQGEWAETSYKLGVVSSLFPPSPLTLQSASTPNVAWATAFIEELIRCGVTQFYVCPGSRSTPLVCALSRALRTNVGVLNALSVHDERGAAFRALGYGRASSRPAAVITSSGTAVSNLYPAVVEAGMDGVPLLMITADRPYESRATGANQAVDQVKSFSSTYVRWFRDIPPPSDDVPVSLALSDANHAVYLSRKLRGPVHLNVQFRENLAPESGPIRNDNRVDSLTSFNGFRFTDVPGFKRWSAGGGKWMKSFSGNQMNSIEPRPLENALDEIAHLIRSSRRGIVVVGNLRTSTDELQSEEELMLTEVVSDFAETVGFPIIAGIQSGSLRFRSTAVIPYAEYILKNSLVSGNIKPDLVLQIGAPLVSTTVADMIASSMKERETRSDSQAGPLHHVLLHPHHPDERSDPNFSVSHRVTSDITPFLKGLLSQLEALDEGNTQCSSELAPLVVLGRKLGEMMPEIIHDASRKVVEKFGGPGSPSQLTEPQVALAMADIMSQTDLPTSLFFSNSMPVRDAEFFFYPTGGTTNDRGLLNVGVNRGASGIDGIISSASGFADANSNSKTALLIGDLAAMHDINALHTLCNSRRVHTNSAKRSPPLTTVVVNNDGGGIFSFLPISRFGNEVNFDEFFGTPTKSFSFEKGSEAFGLQFRRSSESDVFVKAFEEAMISNSPSIIEAVVVGREANVEVHQEINRQATVFVSEMLQGEVERTMTEESIPLKWYNQTDDESTFAAEGKVLLLLHGWMGNKSEWDLVGNILSKSLTSDWNIVSVDLPGHGQSCHRLSSDLQVVRSALGIANREGEKNGFDVDSLAGAVLNTLSLKFGVSSLDAIAGYSLGGRVALAMSRLSKMSSSLPRLVTDDTKLILLSTYPGSLSGDTDGDKQAQVTNSGQVTRTRLDDKLSTEIKRIYSRSFLTANGSSKHSRSWSEFLQRWYGASIWGNLRTRSPERYEAMVNRRIDSLSIRGRDFAAVLSQCSPGRTLNSDWKYVNSVNTLFLAGELDQKYSSIGKTWSTSREPVAYVELPRVGHALLMESPFDVCAVIDDFLRPTNKKAEEGTSLELQIPSSPLEGSESTKDNSRDFVITRSEIEDSEKSLVERTCLRTIGAIDYEPFTISLKNKKQNEIGIVGVGWGDRARASEANRITERSGVILSIISSDGYAVGVGEVSPLSGLHAESLEEVENQINEVKSRLEKIDQALLPEMEPEKLLALDGNLGEYIDTLLRTLDFDKIGPSFRSGLEMALISLASQTKGMPILRALTEFSPEKNASPGTPKAELALCGLIMRGRSSRLFPSQKSLDTIDGVVYPSLKVKVGHQTAKADAISMSNALQAAEKGGKIRADANRAWNEDSAIHFVAALEGIDVDVIDRVEFIEEPLTKVAGEWSFPAQVEALERWHKHSGIPYALDESLADLADLTGNDFVTMQSVIKKTFSDGVGGCAALILKPALLGMELSMRLARIAHIELGIGAVFSSSFDSGLGLGHTSFLAAAADASAPSSSNRPLYSHGLGTFSMLVDDTISPPFSSYVTKQGKLKVSSLSRAFFGLSIDDIRDSVAVELLDVSPSVISKSEADSQDYRASAATSSSGRELSVAVSLPLPFSDDVACSRFSDLPQQSRWSPWLSSVAYVDAGRESEWTLNVRGVRFSWRAVSSVLERPYRGIMWESISGLKNMGVVEFIPTGADSCTMKVRMTIITPRIVASLFPGASVFAEDFLQDKLLRWSLEMFRDVVKGDLALERGDVELGDALFGAVEGRANAIEATLSPLGPNEKSTETEK